MNMHTLKKCICLVIVLVTFVASYAMAESIEPYANLVFESASVSLGRSMDADFYAGTHLTCSSIYVSSCTLQKKDLNGEWTNAGSLPAPLHVAKDESDYLTTADYSTYCTRGNTYRIKAIFKAVSEGVTYSVTRYSNSVDY